jgi:hypothetical protein
VTIPTYSLLERRFLPAQFPPVVAVAEVPTTARLVYFGSDAMQARIRIALRSYARSELNFWKFPIAVFALTFSGAIGLERMLPIGGPIIVALGCFLIGLYVPVKILGQVDVAAEIYAADGEEYGARYDKASIWWTVPGGTYRIAFDDIARKRRRNGVTVVGMRNSRAICVLPDEIVPATIAHRLANRKRSR